MIMEFRHINSTLHDETPSSPTEAVTPKIYLFTELNINFVKCKTVHTTI